MTGIPREDACSRAASTCADPAGATINAFTPRRTWSSRMETCWSMLISRSGATIESRTPGRSAAAALAPSASTSQNSLSMALGTRAMVVSLAARRQAAPPATTARTSAARGATPSAVGARAPLPDGGWSTDNLLGVRPARLTRAPCPLATSLIEVENEAQAVRDGGQTTFRQRAQPLHEIRAKRLLHVVDVRDGRLREARVSPVEADVAGQALQVQTARERDHQE